MLFLKYFYDNKTRLKRLCTRAAQKLESDSTGLKFHSTLEKSEVLFKSSELTRISLKGESHSVSSVLVMLTIKSKRSQRMLNTLMPDSIVLI